MEPKKNPKYDVHRKSGMVFSFSLGCSLLIVITAFEWDTQVTNNRVPSSGSKKTLEEFYYPPISVIDPPPASASPRPVITRPLILTNIVATSDLLNSLEDEPDQLPAPDQSAIVFSDYVDDLPIEKVDQPFTWVEEMPKPQNGFHEFYKQMSQNLKYPAKARRMDTQGRVYVQFIVNEKGELSNIEILKGIGNGCDEEAIRVLLLTKWNPGKQRGKPVKVRMVQPINFNLNN
jgi:protein TonB